MKNFFYVNIKMEENNKKYEICLMVIDTNNMDNLLEAANQYLSQEEMESYNKIKTNKRKKDFLLGRVCAKLSILNLVKAVNPQNISITNGCFRQPLIKGIGMVNYQISITHSEKVGAAIAFPDEILMGIDLEKIDHSNIVSLSNQLTEYEKKEVIQDHEDIKMLTVLWTAKEAISKLLKVGFSSPISVYEVKKVRLDGPYICCSFIYFPQIQSFSVCLKEYVITLAMPSNLIVL